MTDDQPIAIYRSPGPHWGPEGRTYDCSGVPASKLAEAIADGWHPDFTVALGLTLSEPENDPQPADNAPPTRAEMVEQAGKLGIRVDRRWNDETLLAKITAAMAAPAAPAADDPI